MLEGLVFVLFALIVISIPLLRNARPVPKSSEVYAHSSDAYTWQLLNDKRRRTRS